jgi:hypothetical protein
MRRRVPQRQAHVIPAGGGGFSLSLRERAGVRVCGKLPSGNNRFAPEESALLCLIDKWLMDKSMRLNRRFLWLAFRKIVLVGRRLEFALEETKIPKTVE